MRWIEAGRAIMVSAVGIMLVGCAAFSTSGPDGEAKPAMTLAQDDAQLLADARRFFADGNTGLGLARIERYLIANPQSAAAHNLAGAMLDSIGRFDLAESHYKRALAVEPDYLAAVNNFGLSKLQRARSDIRPELELEANELLARALALSGDPAALASSHEAFRAALPVRNPVVQTATAPAAVRNTWLERRAANYTFVVTKPSPDMTSAMAAFNLDPSTAFVSPGASLSATTRLAIAPTLVAMRTWARPSATLTTVSPGLSVLSLKAKPRWYRSVADGCSQPLVLRVAASCGKGGVALDDTRLNDALRTRTNALLKIAVLQ